MKPQMRQCWVAGILLCTLVHAWGQSNPYGLIAIKEGTGTESYDKKPTNSRLYVLGPTNQYKIPVLRLIVADKPLPAGKLSMFEGTILKGTEDHNPQEFKIPLSPGQCSQSAYAQIVDVPITNGPVLEMLVAMFNSPPTAIVAVDVVNADDVSQSKSYIVPVLAIQELRKQYLQAKAAK